MSFSARYHLRGSVTDNPAHLRTMALQFADSMLQPPVYPPVSGNRIRGDENNCLIECQPNLEREQNFFPSFCPEESVQLHRAEANNGILKLSQWLNWVKHAVGYRSKKHMVTLKSLNRRARDDRKQTDDYLRVDQWAQAVENTRGDLRRAQQKSHRRGVKDAAAKAAPAKLSTARDSLQSCLQSMQPTLEVARERHAALLESLSNGLPMVDLEDPVSGNNAEREYLTPDVESEWEALLHNQRRALCRAHVTSWSF